MGTAQKNRVNISSGSAHVALLTSSVAVPLDYPILQAAKAACWAQLSCSASPQKCRLWHRPAVAPHCYAKLYDEVGVLISTNEGVSVRALMNRPRPMSTHMLSSLTAEKDPVGSRTRVEDDHSYKFSLQLMFKGPVDHADPGEG